jgi:hypothetical protein
MKFSGDEHLGSCDRSEAQMSMFRDCIEECGLVDLGFTGHRFTWSNRQEGDDLVLVRLDRAVVNAALMELFDGFRVENIITTTSDHLAIYVILDSLDEAATKAPVQQLFRFEAAWLRAPDYREVMEQSWLEGMGNTVYLQTTCDNLRRVGTSLKKWSRESFGAIQKNIRKLEHKLKVFVVLLVMRMRSGRWRRLYVNSLSGKKGTRTRHSFMLGRRHEEGTIVSLALSALMVRCVMIPRRSKGWCTISMNTFSRPRVVLDAIPQKVTAEMNESLNLSYTDEEIRVALFQMGPTKAPGPDGFPALFYQTHWEFLKIEICSAVRSFLTGDPIPEGFCDSVVVLIPKTTNPQVLKNFRPISLCNVLYKIASKVMANRLKLVLPDVVSENQSAFVPGRLITDNALIAFECLHTIRKQHAKRPFSL